MRRFSAFVCSFVVLVSCVFVSVPAFADDDLGLLPGGVPSLGDSAGLGDEPAAVAGEAGLTPAQEAAVVEAKRVGYPVEVVAEADAQTNNSLEYVAEAQGFLRSPDPGVLTRTRPNGDVVRYDPANNLFGVMDSTGAPKTYFRPNPATHGYPTNLDYFNAQ